MQEIKVLGKTLILLPQAERVAGLMQRLNSSKGMTQEEMQQQGLRHSAMNKAAREQSSKERLEFVTELSLRDPDPSLWDPEARKLRPGCISPATLKELAKFKKLATLSFWGDEITCAGFKEVAKCKQLRRLRIPVSITDAGLKEVAKCKQLRLLHIPTSSITDAGLKEVAKLQQLTTLNLRGCDNVTDAGLKHLAKLKELQQLDLRGCDNVTNTGLKEVAKLQRLFFFLAPTSVTKAGVVELQKALPKCHIYGSFAPTGDVDPPLINDKPTLRIVFYDFDQTIPTKHIFHETGGADDVSNKSDQFFIDAFGGEERITRLKRHFVRLTQTGVKCSIVSNGYTAVIKESLERVGLIDFFEADAIYGQDSEVMRRFRGAKHEVISEEMRLRHISYEEAIFVDDDQENIKACAEAKTCRTLHVHDEDGLTEENMVFLEAGLKKN